MPCIVKLPEIQKAYDKFHDKGFEVVGVSLDEDKDRLEQFIKQKNMPWPEYFDGKRWENKLAVKYGVDATPTGYLLDRNGKIIKQLTGDDDLDSDIAQALKK
jgi:peroxiredoxin